MDAAGLAKLIAGGPPVGAGVPAPARINVMKHAAWRDADQRARELGDRVRAEKAFVFPVWTRAGAGAGAAWEPATVVAFEDGSHVVRAGVTLGPAVVMAVVQHGRTAVIDDAVKYAASELLALRNKHYAVVDVHRVDGVERIERVIDAPAMAAPRGDAGGGGGSAVALAIAVGDLDIGELLGQIVERVGADPR